jgi:hypothetical protein
MHARRAGDPTNSCRNGGRGGAGGARGANDFRKFDHTTLGFPQPSNPPRSGGCRSCPGQSSVTGGRAVIGGGFCMKRRLHSARAKEQRPNVYATRPPLAPVARQSLLALSRPKTRGQTGWMCAATRAGLLPVPRREQQAPTSSNGKPSGLPLWGCWGLTRSLYGYSMSNRIKLNPLARGPDPRFVPKRGPGNLRPRRPCVQLHTSLFRRRSPVQAGRWRRLGYRKLGSGSRVHVDLVRGLSI